MRMFKTLITCAAIAAVATVPAHAQSMGAAKSNAMQGDKSKMSAPDSTEKHAMAKKDGMKDTSAMSKAAMKSDKGMKADHMAKPDKPMMDEKSKDMMSDKSKDMMSDKSKAMMKGKAAKDSGMKHDAMSKDTAMAMPKKPQV